MVLQEPCIPQRPDWDPEVVARIIECGANTSLGELSEPDEFFWKFAHWIMHRQEQERTRTAEERHREMLRLFQLDMKTAVSLIHNKTIWTVRQHHQFLESTPACTIPDIMVVCAERLDVDLTSVHSRYLINAGHMLALAGRTVANSHLDPESCVWWELQHCLDKVKESCQTHEKNICAFRRLPWNASVELLTLMTPGDVVNTAFFWAHAGGLAREDRKIFNLIALGGYCMYEDCMLVPGLPLLPGLIPFVKSVEYDHIYLERAEAHAERRDSLSASSRA